MEGKEKHILFLTVHDLTEDIAIQEKKTDIFTNLTKIFRKKKKI